MKIFDEILVNAADNKQRDSTMDRIDVEIVINKKNKTAPITISIMNNGNGLPIKMHTKEKMYIPQLIFGHILTGSNFNDTETRLTGGRHGFGAKLTNIFSSEFTVETVDSSAALRYVQTWTQNMSVVSYPIVTQLTPEEMKKVKSYTKITFNPDLERFGMKSVDSDMLSVMHKRVIDIAGCNAGVTVKLNGRNFLFKSFRDYIE
jgi:DNA topoisomerase-2